MLDFFSTSTLGCMGQGPILQFIVAKLLKENLTALNMLKFKLIFA